MNFTINQTPNTKIANLTIPCNIGFNTPFGHRDWRSFQDVLAYYHLNYTKWFVNHKLAEPNFFTGYYKL